MAVEKLLKTSLFDRQVKLGAKMAPFAGWHMPLQFDSVLKEHEANRKGCSLFDCSHMGEFIVEGTLKQTGLNQVVTQSLSDLPVKSCRYGMILNNQGGVIDDLIIYRLEEAKWMIVANAANIKKDKAFFLKNLKTPDCFTDISFETAKLDLQGPLSRDVLCEFVPGIVELEYYTCGEFELFGHKTIISRTGYTGELGYEIYYPWDEANRVWDIFLNDKRVSPTGLAVRDVLRIEMTYPLYGHELSDDITPFEAGMKRFIDLDKEFVGKEALVVSEKTRDRKIIFFTSSSRRAPRQGHQLFSEAGEILGEVVSGTFSPALERGIGIGFLKKSFTNKDNVIIFGDERRKENAALIKRPFYKEGTLKI